MKNSKFIVLTLVLVLSFLHLVKAEGIYDRDPIIVVDGTYNIRDLASLPPEDFEIIGNICYLKKPLHMTNATTLYITSDSCLELLLYPNTYIRVSGKIYFDSIKVSSYDPDTGMPLTISRSFFSQPRPYIYTQYPTLYFSAINTEFSNLGYYEKSKEGSSWGVALYDTERGIIKNSDMHDNYFGFYTFNTTYLTISDSKIHDNLEYGLDFHDYSSYFLIYNNQVHDNGNHGIIFSKWCDYNEIIGNKVFNNTQNTFVKGEEHEYGTHGIMLHHDSKYNTIAQNEVDNNRVGIYLMDSNYNKVVDNIVYTDLEDGIYLERSNNTYIGNNSVYKTGAYGAYSYYSYNTTYRDNNFERGMFFKATENGKEYRVESLSKDFYPGINDEISSQLARNESLFENISVPVEKTKELSQQEYLSFKILTIAVLIGVAILIILFELVVLGRRK